jgi:multidrug efflux pump subunit AcrB
VAHTLEAELKRVAGVREVQTIGGPGRALNVELDPSRLRERGVDLLRLKQTLAAANFGMPAGQVARTAAEGGGMLSVETGEYLRDAQEVGDLVVGVHGGRPDAQRPGWRPIRSGDRADVEAARVLRSEVGASWRLTRTT